MRTLKEILRPLLSLAVGTFGMIALFELPVLAQCVTQAMEGKWINANSSGILKRITIDFRCCDTTGCGAGQPCTPRCTPPNDTVRSFGPCSTNANCDWGTVVPHYVFFDQTQGQTTRVDATYSATGEKREVILLLLGSDQLQVHWSIDYTNPNTADYSLIETFNRQRCIKLSNGQEVCFFPLNPLRYLRDPNVIQPQQP